MKFKFKNSSDGCELSEKISKHVYHSRGGLKIVRVDDDEIELDGVLYHHDFLRANGWVEVKYSGFERGYQMRNDSNAKWYFVHKHYRNLIIVAMDDDFNYLFSFFNVEMVLSQLDNDGKVDLKDIIKNRVIFKINHNYNTFGEVNAVVESLTYVEDSQLINEKVDVMFFTNTDIHEQNKEYKNIPVVEFECLRDANLDLKIIDPVILNKGV